ncbi:hypothetical protein [Candidatus Finniella inopinata]|uniref:Heparin-sulfate lyase N-terminal domain-containing protein n=1 Tax=Candidatus Finniella inopinata TaxID=1696036 RepID=A0A4Q7DHH7_9PROT|nr:hypothetical protein [Candidatus Finniella inopinata]RZI46381.1 hypothetical protein EQU50_01975 [Candidatus Finniella inopinata]
MENRSREMPASFSRNNLLTISIVLWFWWLVTPEIGRVRERIDKILLLLFKARELPGVESWNRFRDFSRISMGLEPHRKTLLKNRKIAGNREIRVVVEWRGGRCGIFGRPFLYAVCPKTPHASEGKNWFKNQPPFLHRKIVLIKSRNFLGRWKRLLQATPLYGLRLMGSTESIPSIVLTDLWPGDSMAGQSLVEGSFKMGDYFVPLKEVSRFLSHSRECPKGFLLFLHSFEWLRDLRTAGTNASRKRARELIKYWIQSHGSWARKNWLEPSWYPEVMGQRIRFWLSLYDFFGATADDEFKRLFFTSLHRQYRYLQNNYKTHTRTDWQHFQALVGLIFATCCLEKTSYRLAVYMKELEKLLSRQLFEDGGHVSRSPKIQFFLLRDLIDMRGVLRSCGVSEPEFLQQAIQHIAPIVRFFRHTSGELAHFSGALNQVDALRLSCHFLSSAMVDRVLSLSDTRSRGGQRCADTGYERLTSKGGVIILNTKPCYSGDQTTDKAFGMVDFEWSVLQRGLVCASDLIFHDASGNIVSLDGEGDSNSWKLETSRHHKDGSHHLWAQLHCHKGGFDLMYEREFYLAADPHDFRGQEKIIFNQEGVAGIRFIFDRSAEIINQSKRSIKIKLSSVSADQPGHIYRLASSGAEQLISYPLQEGKLGVVLMTAVQAHSSKIIKWGFQLAG